MSKGTKTKEEEPVYYNTKYLELPFRFQYSQEDYANHLPILNDMTSLEETKINNFLNYIDETELKFKIPPEETEDIIQAVSEVVDKFAKHLENVDPLLAVSHKYAVGSMAEGTKIKEPDEFDFILVLKELTADIVSVESISEDDIYIECDGTDCLSFCHIHVPQPVIQKCTGDISYQHVHLPLSSLAYSKRNKKIPGKWKRLGYISCWKKHFLQCLDRDSDGLLKVLNLQVTKGTGTIKNVNEDINEIYRYAGPAMTLALLWEPKTGNNLEISVDLVLAIERNGVENVIAMDEIPCQIYQKILLETDQFFLVPILAADTDVCFKVTVTTTEHKIMSNLSKPHILCYRTLKYLFQGHSNSGHSNCKDLLHSYILKTFLLRHTAMCMNQDNPAQCLTNILKNLSIALKLCKLIHKSAEQMTVEHLFIPGLLINSSSFINEDISKYLMANAEQLFEVAKSEDNDQIKNLEVLKDVWKRIGNEVTQYTGISWDSFVRCHIHDIATGPGEPIDKLHMIANTVDRLQVTGISMTDIVAGPGEATDKLHMIARLTDPLRLISLKY